MKHTLFLGSQSRSRQQLLSDVQIPFTIVSQGADESKCDYNLPLQQLVERIVLYKMEHVVLPAGKEGQVCFVLTADTMSQDAHGVIHGKPKNRDDAVAKIKAARSGNFLVTSFCLDKKLFHGGVWQLDNRICQSVSAEFSFIIPDKWIDQYLEQSWVLSASGAITVEGFGMQFLKAVHGSYSAIIGLPIFEVREALANLGFYD